MEFTTVSWVPGSLHLLKNTTKKIWIIFGLDKGASSMAKGANKSTAEKVCTCFQAEEAEIDYFPKAESR